jgi:uncharacterized membrane protein
MLGPGLALASALVYGVVDYAGGILSRRVNFAVVSFVGQLGGLLAAVVAAVLANVRSVQTADLGWGALSGLGTAATMLFINRGVSRGALSVVVPISAVTGIALSVLCGVMVLGERPGALAWVGILLVLPALWCITGGSASRVHGAVGDGLIAESLGVVELVTHESSSSADGLCTASLPVLSLRTRYCGSSSEARTGRPAASVSSVISSTTSPCTVCPWLDQVTSSPSWGFFSPMGPLCAARRRLARRAPDTADHAW